MIQCNQCSTEYDDDATYCNICQCALSENNTHTVFDSRDMQENRVANARYYHEARYALVLIACAFPFALYADWLPFAANITQKITILMLAEVLCLINLITVNYPRFQHHHTTAFYILIAFLALFFPLGWCGIALLVFLRAKNSSRSN